jgi:acetolactate synthase regulatory subunit
MANMNHSLNITLSSAEGAVIRTLGLIERRGFGLDSCSVGEILDNRRAMEVSVTSTRSADLLKRQLERLHDVYTVEVKPAVLAEPGTPGIRSVKGNM